MDEWQIYTYVYWILYHKLIRSFPKFMKEIKYVDQNS